MIVFLRWWLVFWLSVVGAVVAGFLGFYPYLWRSDSSYLSWACFALYGLMTVFVGQLTYQARLGVRYPVTQHLPLCWFTANALMTLGLIGTLAGFLIIPEAISGGLTDPAKVLSRAAQGLSTAGLTTIVGIVCSSLLKLQLVNLEYLLPDEAR